MNKLAIATFAASTALVPAAFAQDSNDHCTQLSSYAQANDISASGITREQADRIAARNDDQTCNDALRMARGDISQFETDKNFDADATARIRVDVPQPKVTVDQPAPEVTVDQARPDVDVTPGRPVVTVNQAEPVVHVQIPQPRITIDMPKPSITVAMPDPNVDVTMPKPQVTVSQADPTVSVEQGKVDVAVSDAQSVDNGSDTGQSSDVSVDKGAAQVRMNQAARANVTVGDVTPVVRYQAAKPRIEVDDSGEPDIQFNQSGEADVQFRQMSEDETRRAAEQQQAAAGQTAGQSGTQSGRADGTSANADRASDQMASTDTAATGRTASQSDGSGMAYVGSTQHARQDNVRTLGADNIMAMQVIGANGDNLGDLQDIILYQNEPYVVIGNGGFLGIGEKEVALPLNDMVLRSNELHMRQVTQDDIDSMGEIDPDNFRSASGSDGFRVATGS